MTERKTIHSLAEMETFAFEMGKKAKAGDVLFLEGEMGMGKTTFVQHFVKGVGSPEMVSSPTFRIIHEYTQGRLPVVHMDLYRLKSEQEVLAIDVPGYIRRDGVTLIEWPELVESWVQGPVKLLEFSALAEAENGRQVEMKSLVLGGG